jgi:hypothetical protein
MYLMAINYRYYLALKIDKMAIKITNIYHSKTFQKFSNWDFWFENIPSGNTALKIMNKCFPGALRRKTGYGSRPSRAGC